MAARLKILRNDGQTYLERWGFQCKWFGILIHRMDAPDPGPHLHDHPFAFWSVILKGGYHEERCSVRAAARACAHADEYEEFIEECDYWPRGEHSTRKRFSIKRLGLDEAHRITELLSDHSWSLVIHGPKVRPWGFYLADGWINERSYGQLYHERFEEAR